LKKLKIYSFNSCIQPLGIYHVLMQYIIYLIRKEKSFCYSVVFSHANWFTYTFLMSFNQQIMHFFNKLKRIAIRKIILQNAYKLSPYIMSKVYRVFKKLGNGCYRFCLTVNTHLIGIITIILNVYYDYIYIYIYSIPLIISLLMYYFNYTVSKLFEHVVYSNANNNIRREDENKFIQKFISAATSTYVVLLSSSPYK